MEKMKLMDDLRWNCKVDEGDLHENEEGKFTT